MGKTIGQMTLEELKQEKQRVQELRKSIVDQINEIDADEKESSLEISGEFSELRNTLEERLTGLITLSKLLSAAITKEKAKIAFPNN